MASIDICILFCIMKTGLIADGMIQAVLQLVPDGWKGRKKYGDLRRSER